MTIVNDKTEAVEPKRYKMGDVREDGMVFIEYKKGRKNPEWWSTPEMYQKKLAKARKRTREWAKKNPSLKKQRDKQYRENNKDKAQAYNLSYYEKNSDKIKKRARDWAVSNPERAKHRRKKYREENKESINQYFKERRENDSLFRLCQNMRGLISISLKKRSFSKKSNTEEILGCSFEEFFNHIESQFLEGMSWENRSEWHIDHIMPLASAKTEEEILRLNHYTNLRPLWATDNIKKGSKILCH
jgi:hypothetical protein